MESRNTCVIPMLLVGFRALSLPKSVVHNKLLVANGIMYLNRLVFTNEFREALDGAGVRSIKLPPRSPNLNANAERFVLTIKESCLDRMIFFSELGLQRAIKQFVQHYHLE